MPDCVQNVSRRPAGRRARSCTRRIHRGPGCPDLPSNVVFLDIADASATPTFCPAVIGNVLVYIDDNHLTASYSTSMAGLLGDATVAALSG